MPEDRETQRVGRKDYKGSQRTFWDNDMFNILIVVTVSHMYTCVKTYQLVCFKHVQCIVDQVFTIARFLLFSLS